MKLKHFAFISTALKEATEADMASARIPTIEKYGLDSVDELIPLGGTGDDILSTYDHNSYNSKELPVFEYFANQVAIAVDNRVDQKLRSETKVKLGSRGEIPVNEIVIPDIWNDMMRLKNCDGRCPEMTLSDRARIADRALEVWHLAHSFRKHIKGE